MSVFKLAIPLNKCWSKDTCYPKVKDNWSNNNKPLGQCAITSLLVDDYFDCEIYKCKVDGTSHYYNKIEGKIIDLTKEQFGLDKLEYKDIKQVNRDSILANDDTRDRYKKLKSRLDKVWGEEMNIEQEMFENALDFLNQRYGENKAGGVAILRIEDGNYLTSIWPESNNESVTLCAEVGAICEAHKLNKKVTHSLCVCRQNDNENYEILSPCGVCQERLFYWGDNVLCAISTKDNSILFKTLKELQPYYWLDKK